MKKKATIDVWPLALGKDFKNIGSGEIATIEFLCKKVRIVFKDKFSVGFKRLKKLRRRRDVVQNKKI